jgi:hypothetical protein
MAQGDEENNRILEKYGDLLSDAEKKEFLENSQPPCAPPYISWANSKRKANSIAFYVVFSVLLSILTYIRVYVVDTKIPTREYYFSFVLLCLVSIPQLLRLKWQYRDEDRSALYVRVLIAISLSWLLFSAVFYFTSSPLLISSCALLTLPEIRNGLWTVYAKAREITPHSPQKEAFSLLYIAMVSFLCLFSIAGLPWLMAIFMFFWYIAVKLIARFKPPARLLKSLQTMPKSEQMDNPVGRYFFATITSPLSMLHSLGGLCFCLLLVHTAYISKMHLVLLLSIWGQFLWNTVMIEIQLYAKDEQKKTALLYGEDLL